MAARETFTAWNTPVSAAMYTPTIFPANPSPSPCASPPTPATRGWTLPPSKPTLPANADPSTAWAEGVSGAGEGEWLSLFFSEQNVAGFAIRAGYQRSADTYNASGRPANIRVSVAGEADCTVALDDARGEQVVLFSHPVVTDFLSIEISSVYGGTGNAYTCISDVRVLLAG